MEHLACPIGEVKNLDRLIGLIHEIVEALMISVLNLPARCSDVPPENWTK